MRRLSIPLLVLACSPNPAYDPPSATSATTSTGPASPTTTGDTTATPDPTTAGPTSSTGAIVDETTTDTTAAILTTGESTSSTSTSTSTTTTGESTTTADTDAPLDCWDQPPESWAVPPIPLDDFADFEPIDPDISLDGLALVYIATTSRRPFRATRVNRTDPFPNGKQIALWSGSPDLKPGYPHFSQDGEEMVMGYLGDIYWARYKAGDPNQQYEEPLPFAGAINTPKQESPLTITADGTVVITTRRLDENAPFPYDFHFIQLTRAAPEPGAEFLDPIDVTPSVPPHKFALCPTVSPDGLRLFFSSTTAPDFNEMNAADVIRIFMATRPTVVSPWEKEVELTAFEPGGGVLCPSSVTADGCGLAYSKFPFGRFADMPYTMYLRERPP